MAVSTAPVRDARIMSLGARLSGSALAFWGGSYTVATGETVTVYASDAYPEDPATGQHWADFLAGLLHGSELPRLTTYIVTTREVRSLCGADALACYSDLNAKLVVPGEDAPHISVEALITHEYGHHVASFRRNDPWPAVDWGTKRWATHERVCARAARNELYPGAETASQYARNPGEGFAETYRVLNERRAGIPEAPWEAVDAIFYPDEPALALTEQDVLSPWAGNTTSTLRGSFRAAARTRTFALATLLDGTLGLRVTAPPGGSLTLELQSVSGARVARATAQAGKSAAVKTTICGARAYRARVTRLTGSGAYALSVSKP